ncbi:methyltransferase family protein [Nonomuraea rubra]
MGPVVVTIAIPALIIALAGTPVLPLDHPWTLVSTAAGVVLIAAGAGLLAWTIALFDRLGQGTLSPLEPTQRLVVSGPYRHVRNPMFSGVLAILLGEAAITRSIGVLAWFVLFWTILAILIPLVEEPKLARRFGADYDHYRDHVPRWLPRRRPWQP